VAIGGDPRTAYDVTLRIRAVVEQQTYAGGTADAPWQTEGVAAQASFNIAALHTTDPERAYFLNAGSAGLRRVWPLDYQRTIRVRGGSVVTLSLDSQDWQQISAFDDRGAPVAVTDLPPFDGQFVELEVVAATPVP
jgi:hypothetical protein